MKKKFVKTISGSLAFLILFAISIIPFQGKSIDESTRLEECAEKVFEIYNTQSDDMGGSISETPLAEFSAQDLARNSLSNEYYNKILTHIETTKDELSQYFSGAYLNEDYILVVMTSGEMSACERIITEELGCTDVIIEQGNGSYLETKQQLSEMNKQVAEMYRYRYEEGSQDKDLVALIEAKPIVVLDGKTNQISVAFTSPVEEKKMEMIETADLATATMNIDSLIETFESYVGKYENVQYTTETETSTETVSSSTEEEWRPGRALYTFKSSSVSRFSTGYRAKYTYNSKEYYGFVTCGHSVTATGQSVYLSNVKDSAYKIGVIMNYEIGDTIDAAFLRITNSSYTPSNTIFYTSSTGLTKPGTVLDGTQTDVAIGSILYKSGSTTYLTSGTVTDANATVAIDYSWGTVYLYDLITTTTMDIQSGDSGGVVFIPIGGSSIYGKAVGVITSKKSTGGGSITKAINISSLMGPIAY